MNTLKRSLRKELTARLLPIPKSTIDVESKQILHKLLELDEYKASRHVSVFISMPSGEVDTDGIIRHLLDSEKTCFIPRCTKNTMDMVEITSWEDYKSLPKNKWDIPEPPLDQVRNNDQDGLDLILMPGNYYDRYLKKCYDWASERGREPPKTVALALEAQIVDADVIPLEPTDEKVGCILTASKIIR
ncbi:hypothetical protein DFQ30_005058 [Apophysomyces sp. BC1015]|nr:hypothetical protein DFQ30_005058 [Apophysomyces sp. BC1015]